MHLSRATTVDGLWTLVVVFACVVQSVYAPPTLADDATTHSIPSTAGSGLSTAASSTDTVSEEPHIGDTSSPFTDIELSATTVVHNLTKPHTPEKAKIIPPEVKAPLSVAGPGMKTSQDEVHVTSQTTLMESNEEEISPEMNLNLTESENITGGIKSYANRKDQKGGLRNGSLVNGYYYRDIGFRFKMPPSDEKIEKYTTKATNVFAGKALPLIMSKATTHAQNASRVTSHLHGKHKTTARPTLLTKLFPKSSSTHAPSAKQHKSRFLDEVFGNYHILYETIKKETVKQQADGDYYAWLFGIAMAGLGSLTVLISCIIMCCCHDRWNNSGSSSKALGGKFDKNFEYKPVKIETATA